MPESIVPKANSINQIIKSIQILEFLASRLQSRKRCITLGLLYSRVWYADILHFYGAYFVMSVFVVNASNRFLITLSAAALTFTLFLEIHYNFVTLPVIDRVEHVPTLEISWMWATIFCLLAIPFSYWWVNHFGRGPFEKALRLVSK